MASKDPAFPASLWKDHVVAVQAEASKLPRQSLYPFFKASPHLESKPDKVPSWEKEGAYGKYFAAAMKKAIAAKKLEENAVPLPRESRPSAKNKALQGECPSLQATADVVGMILEHQYGADCKDVREKCPSKHITVVADLSQACNRNSISVRGTWGCLTTSSRLFDFESGRFLAPSMHMQVLGFDCEQMDIKGLQDRESWGQVFF